MNISDVLYLKRTKDIVKSNTLQNTLSGEGNSNSLKLGQWQNSLKRNRKNNFNTRSVWYDDNDVEKSGFTLRKSHSLDSLLIDKKPSRVKITKDMISAPMCPRKITGQWNTIAEDNHPILEEHVAEHATSSESDNDSDDLSSISQENNTRLNLDAEKNVVHDVLDEEINYENINSEDIFRQKDRNDSLNESDKRKNILYYFDYSIMPEFKNEKDITLDIESIKQENDQSQCIEDSNLVLDNQNKQKKSVQEITDIEQNMTTQIPNDLIDISDQNSELFEKYSETQMTEYDIGNNENLKNEGNDFLQLISNGNISKSTSYKKKINVKKNKKYNEKSVEPTTNLKKMKFLSKSTDIVSTAPNEIEPEKYEEVLRTLQTNKDEPLSRSVGPFPKTDENLISGDVQLRNRNDNRLRQSKTIDYDPRRYIRNQDFEVKGCSKIQMPENVQIKLRKNEYLRYQNNTIIKSDETNSQVLKFGVILKSIKLTNKREAELKDVNNQIYILVFDSSKDAKVFIENEKVSCFTDSEKSTITKTLLRLLGKRSSREVLEKKGIYQNEPIFGNTLKNIYNAENGVPKFILKTIELIESPDNITSLGLYRTSGNLATIQKIRLEVDKGNLDILDVYAKDPDVLTGSLKLFFRELKEPLLSCKTCDNLLEFTKTDKNYCKKDRENIRTIMNHIPEANAETVLALIRHLIEVVKYKETNKMDTYNLAVCWGPTIIFATDNFYTKDLVTQSAEATKLFDALLNFYINNPEELDCRKKKPDYFDSNRNMIHRQDSKDSIHSSDSNNSSNKNKSLSNLSLDAIDEVIKKSVDLIETRLDTEGIYKKHGSPEKVSKIFRKMMKRKLPDLEKYRNDVYELTESLKKYLREGCDSMVTKETVEHVNKICDNTQWLEHNTRQKVRSIIMDAPKKDSLLFLLRHLIKLMKYESSHNVTKAEMLWIWSKVLNDQYRIVESDEKIVHFLKILVDVFDETKSDITVMPKGMSNGLLNDLKNLQKEKDRISKYDNVPDESDYFNKEATIYEEKTEESEQTKL